MIINVNAANTSVKLSQWASSIFLSLLPMCDCVCVCVFVYWLGSRNATMPWAASWALSDRKRGAQFRDRIPYFLHSRFFSEVFSKSFCIFFFSSAPPKSSNSSPRSSTHSPNSPPNYSPYSPNNSSGNSCPHSSLSGSSRFFPTSPSQSSPHNSLCLSPSRAPSFFQSFINISLCIILQVFSQVSLQILLYTVYTLFNIFNFNSPSFSPHSSALYSLCSSLRNSPCLFPSFVILLHILLQTIFKLLSEFSSQFFFPFFRPLGSRTPAEPHACEVPPRRHPVRQAEQSWHFHTLSIFDFDALATWELLQVFVWRQWFKMVSWCLIVNMVKWIKAFCSIRSALVKHETNSVSKSDLIPGCKMMQRCRWPHPYFLAGKDMCLGHEPLGALWHFRSWLTSKTDGAYILHAQNCLDGLDMLLDSKLFTRLFWYFLVLATDDR